MSASTHISASDGVAEETPALPFWATSVGVHVIACVYFFIFFLIAVTLHSTLGVDDAVENYNAQSLAISYSPRNPPLYDWILYGIQMLTGPNAVSFAILNYGSLLASMLILYKVARRAIADPRLQALSIFAYSLLWDIGHEWHRILTHSNLMIVGVTATTLMLVKLAAKPTLASYLWLGFWTAFGILAKLGFVAFIAALFLATLAVPRYRALLLDRRVAATIAVALLPVAVFFAAEIIADHSIVGETENVLSTGSGAGFLPRFVALTRSLVGYVVPLLPIAALVFYRQPEQQAEDTPERRDLRLLFGVILGIGVVFAIIWALVIGSTQLRPRYFHALLLLFPLALFSFLDRRAWPLRQLNVFVRVAFFVAIGIMVEQTLPRLMPSDFLCEECRLGIPYDALGRELEERYGRAPTLVGLDTAYAGRLRAAVPEARTVTLSAAHYRPPFRDTAHCILVWLDEGADLATMAAAAGFDAGKVETVALPWFQPLLAEPRQSRFNLAALPETSSLCR